MKRRARLRARTPLVRRTPLVARGELEPRRNKPAVPDDVRAALRARSGGVCELRLPYCLGAASEAHHRITRKMGGRSAAGKRGADRLSNLIHCCPYCHGWVTARPKESYDAGWSLREGQDPALVPVVFGTDLVYLADDGRVAPFEAVGA